MFIDETGNPSIDSKESFSMTGVIFKRRYCLNDNGDSSLKKELNKLKMKYFKNKDINLHLLDISQGRKDYRYYTKNERCNFIKALPLFLKDIDCKIISITIDKKKLAEYYEPAKDPYTVGFMSILQSFYCVLNENNIESAVIVIEGRDDYSNLLVQKAFFDVYNNGTLQLQVIDRLKNKIKGFVIAKKGDPLYQSGLEIADLICNPLCRVRLGKIELNPKCMKRGEYGVDNMIFKAIKNKIYCKNDVDDIRNWGFKKVPIVKKKRLWIDNPKIESD